MRLIAFTIVCAAVCAFVTLGDHMPRHVSAAEGAGNAFRYEDLAPGALVLGEPQQLEYALVHDLKLQRAHAWRLWAALNAPAASHWNGQALPVWQTWYDSEEIFHLDKPRHARFDCCGFEQPRQHVLEHRADAPILGFVRMNLASLRWIKENGYDRQATLTKVNAGMNAGATPTRLREILPSPSDAVALKVTFSLIRGTGTTAMPYWDPNAPPPPDGFVPIHTTWQKCVDVDPTNTIPEGTIHRVDCNARPGKHNFVDAKVMHLSRFLAYELKADGEVSEAITASKHLSMDIDQEHVVTGLLVPRKGDWLVVTAMHVETHELPRWAFQTFWWTPNANAAPFGNDRPDAVRGAARSYAMCTAYDEVLPRQADGSPHVCFDPYLEADLGPLKPVTMDGRTTPVDPMAGTHSNCLECHARAGFPVTPKPPYGFANMGRVRNSGYEDRNGLYYAKITTSDFLWSIPLEARAPKKK